MCVVKLPDKIATNRAKRGLPKVSGHELVAIDLMHLATQRYATHVERLRILFEHFHVGIVGGNGGFLDFFLKLI